MNTDAIAVELVEARALRPGDVLVLPIIGQRVIAEVHHDETIGLTGRPAVRVVYELGSSTAFENRTTKTGPSAVDQPLATLRLLAPDERVRVAVPVPAAAA